MRGVDQCVFVAVVVYDLGVVGGSISVFQCLRVIVYVCVCVCVCVLCVPHTLNVYSEPTDATAEFDSSNAPWLYHRVAARTRVDVIRI